VHNAPYPIHLINSSSVLKQVHPDTGISNKTMAILSSFVTDIFERIATEASSMRRVHRFTLCELTHFISVRICYLLQEVHHLIKRNSNICGSYRPCSVPAYNHYTITDPIVSTYLYVSTVDSRANIERRTPASHSAGKAPASTASPNQQTAQRQPRRQRKPERLLMGRRRSERDKGV
jgi:hypothetical protein